MRFKKRGLALIAAFLVILVGCQKKENDSVDHKDSEKSAYSKHGEHSHLLDGRTAPEGIQVEENPLYPVGSEVLVKAEHMPGMKGVKAKVVGAYKTYTYSVDYQPVNGDEEVLDHKWVVHEELEEPGESRLEDGAQIKIRTNHMDGMEGAKGVVAYSTEETVYMIDFVADGLSITNHKWVVESELEKL